MVSAWGSVSCTVPWSVVVRRSSPFLSTPVSQQSRPRRKRSGMRSRMASRFARSHKARARAKESHPRLDLGFRKELTHELETHGLHHMMIETRLEGALHIRRFIPSRYRDHQRTRSPRSLPHEATGATAIHARQADVHEDHFRFFFIPADER